MKKQRTQWVYVGGRRQIVDVPVDDVLFKADMHNEYQRIRSKDKDVSLDECLFADLSVDVAKEYEKRQLINALREALQTLTMEERQLVVYLYDHQLTEQEAAGILEITQQAVTKRKHKILKKLRKCLEDWL